MTSGATMLLALAASLVVAVAGVVQYASGSAQRDAAVARARTATGERAHRRWRGVLEDRLRSTALGRTLEARLQGAGLTWGVADLLAAVTAATTGGWIVGSATAGVPAGVLLAVLAGYAPFAWIQRQRGLRRDGFIAQLPDVARTMANASAAGLSLRSALSLASSEMDAPAADELTRVSEELQLGWSLEDALTNLDLRMPSREIGVLIATLVVQHRAGGNLVDALRDMAATLDDRKDLRREIRTLLSGTVATSYVVAMLGIGSVLLVTMASPDAVGQLLASGLGRLVVALAVLLYVVGFVLIARVTRIES